MVTIPYQQRRFTLRSPTDPMLELQVRGVRDRPSSTSEMVAAYAGKEEVCMLSSCAQA